MVTCGGRASPVSAQRARGARGHLGALLWEVPKGCCAQTRGPWKKSAPEGDRRGSRFRCWLLGAPLQRLARWGRPGSLGWRGRAAGTAREGAAASARCL